MAAQVNANGNLNISTMNLVDFLTEIVQATKNGWILDMDKNEGFPQVIGSLHLLTLFPVKSEEKVDGRKKKV